MSDHDIILTYRRRKELVGDEHLFDGSIMLVDNDVASDLIKLEGVTFAVLIAEFSGRAHAYPGCRMFMHRKELENSTPVRLDDTTALRILENPVEYAREMTLAPVRVVVRKDLAGTAPIVQQPIKAGYDALADAFGDSVYLSLRHFPTQAFECPMCGRWQTEVVDEAAHCHLCSSYFRGSVKGARWVEVSTQELLNAGRFIVKRFYIPRAWNKPGPWISYDDLEARYKAFLKEKESCFRHKDDR